MAEVTGFTADRMLEIENDTIVSGSVVNGSLILETRDEQTIDAGRVIGIERVIHGSDPNVPRPPLAPIVYWIGSSDPVNARPWDFHLKEDITI